jgi:cell division protein FtsB
MWGKIKSMLGVLLRGTFGGWQGALGALMIGVSLYFSIGLFNGVASIQNYFKNRIALGRADEKIAVLQKQLDAENLHIKLLQEHSPDFISEMALRHLNLGDPKLLILKK